MMDVGAAAGAPVLFAVELAVLYAAGSHAMGRLVSLAGIGGVGSLPRRIVFHILVFPGVVLHESAHYLACLLTGTRVYSFAPFTPGRSRGGRITLGYVRHERRVLPIGAIIGVAPVLINPLGLLLVTAILTPLTLREVADPSVEVVVGGVFASGYLTDAPLLAATWVYLSSSFALGSVPSREDLSGLLVMLVLLVAVILASGLLGARFGGGAYRAIHDLFALAAGLYAVPAAVAAAVALATVALGRP
jgi:hypothetical protein